MTKFLLIVAALTIGLFTEEEFIREVETERESSRKCVNMIATISHTCTFDELSIELKVSRNYENHSK